MFIVFYVVYCLSIYGLLLYHKVSIKKVHFNHSKKKTSSKPGNIAIFISKGGPGDVLLEHVAGRVPDPSEDVEPVLAEVGVVPQVEKVVRHVLLGQLLQKKDVLHF